VQSASSALTLTAGFALGSENTSCAVDCNRHCSSACGCCCSDWPASGAAGYQTVQMRNQLLTCRGDGWQKTVCTASGGKCLDSTSCRYARPRHTSVAWQAKEQTTLRGCRPDTHVAAVPCKSCDKCCHAQSACWWQEMHAYWQQLRACWLCQHHTCVRRKMNVAVWRCSSLQQTG
jgi:hypothetical protein